jgi:SRSO17 transposase
MDVSALGIIEIDETPPPLDLTPVEIEALAETLLQYHAEFAPLYYRQEQAHWGYKYLQGLMLPLERKSIEPMALALEGGHVQAMQPFLGQGQWQDEALLQQPWRWGNETLGENDGVCIVDSSEFPQQGEQSVGVARQWCGRVGKVDNCQSGVCTADASRTGYTLLDRRRYLPDECFDAAHRERWHRGGIPAETRCTTKQPLALERLQALVTTGTLRVRWVTCDAAFGRDGAFLDGVAALRRWSFAAVPHDTQVWLSRPATAVPPWSGRGRRPRTLRLVPGAQAPQRVDQLAAAVPPDAWQAFLMKEGSKGPLVAECTCHRGVAVRAGVPGPDVWIVLRRTWGEAPELKVYLSKAPGHIPVTALVRVAGMRWPIETAFEESKGGLGLDHYEVRSWLGWHHHLTLCLLAHHCLVRTRILLQRGRRR